MTRPLARMGDRTTHGGTISSGATQAGEPRPIATMGDPHACPYHGMGVIISGDPVKTIGGRPMARLGDFTDCGAVIIGSVDIC